MGSTAILKRRTPGYRAETADAAGAPRYKFDVLRVSLALLIVINVSRIHQRFGLLAALRPGLLLTGLALAAAIAAPRRALAHGWMGRWQAQVTFGITVVALGSVAFGISQGGAFYYFSNYFSKVLASAFLLMLAIRNARDLWMFTWAYVFGAGLVVWMALFVFDLTVGSNGVARLDNLEGWDANDVCVLLLMGLGFGLLAYQTSGKRGKVAAGIVIAGIGAAIARSGSRGGFLGLAALLLAYLLTMQHTSVAKRVGLVVVLAVGLMVAAPANYWTQMSTISSVKSDYNWDSEQGRRQLAIRGMGYMWTYPVFGLGVDNFGRAEAFISDFGKKKAESGQGVKWSAVHNSYIQAGAEMGVLGFLLFIGLVLGCIVSPWMVRRRIPLDWEHGDWDQRFLIHATRYLPLAAIGFAVPAFFVSFAYLDPIYMLAAMTGALAASVQVRLRSGASTPDGLPVRRSGWRSLT